MDAMKGEMVVKSQKKDVKLVTKVGDYQMSKVTSLWLIFMVN